MPNLASFGSADRAGSSQADLTEGRSVDCWYHFTWVFGSESHCTSFQALSRFLEFLKTAKLEPPTNDDDLVFAGTSMTSYWSFFTPTFSTADIIHGPEMNIGTRPLLKSGSVVGVFGAALSEMPSVK